MILTIQESILATYWSSVVFAWFLYSKSGPGLYYVVCTGFLYNRTHGSVPILTCMPMVYLLMLFKVSLQSCFFFFSTFQPGNSLCSRMVRNHFLRTWFLVTPNNLWFSAIHLFIACGMLQYSPVSWHMGSNFDTFGFFSWGGVLDIAAAPVSSGRSPTIPTRAKIRSRSWHIPIFRSAVSGRLRPREYRLGGALYLCVCVLYL